MRIIISLIYLIFFSLIINSCEKKKETPSTILAEIRNLESVRNTEADKWKNLFDRAGTQIERRQVIRSAGYTRNGQLLPFFIELFKKEKDDSIKKLLLFGIGQTTLPQAEAFFLKTEPDSLPFPLRQAFFAALSHCCTKKSLPLLKKWTKRYKEDDTFIQNLSLCLSKLPSAHEFIPAVIDTGKNRSVSKAQAYLLSRTAAFSDIPLLIDKLSGARGSSKKYLLKGLYRKMTKDSARFKRILEQDSASFMKLRSEIRRILKSGKKWRRSYYTLALSRHVADSSFAGLYKRFLDDDLIHLQVEAWRAYASLLPANFSAELLSALARHKKNHYLRAQLLKLLAHYKPELAYSLIMKELGEGDSFSKSELLYGLSATNLERAFATIRQFLNVPDRRLVNTAFQCLSASQRLSVSDRNKMLRSSDVGSIGAVFDYYQSAPKILKEMPLFEIYKRFNTVAGVEIQKIILTQLKSRNVRMDSTRKNTLLEFAAHPVVLRQLKKDFGLVRKGKDALSTPLPPHLRADSLIHYSRNPVLNMVTSRGNIRLELFADLAPHTVQNFIYLAKKGFYNQLPFHRVIADFVIQGGDPRGDGWGGPEYLIPSEDNSAPFLRGSLGMATAGFDTGGSQFFICQSEQPHLTGNYTLFGAVISGMDVVDQIVPGDKILNIEADANK